MKVVCEIQAVQLTDESGRLREGVQAICGECDHITQSYGTHANSVVRCLALLREQCPCGDENFYVSSEDGEEWD